ncbi:MAG TPA: HAMP domain-containing sensor histidine kinase [Acidimicrobiales bacterium]|nr:HAMP domain-containing sensor histidine kinase [Acidimicrobiales bacterium]
MRRRITLAVVLVAFVAVVAFAVPLAVGVTRLYRDENVLRLEREAERAVAAVPESFLVTADPVELPRPPDGIATGVYDLDGHRVVGDGPDDGGALVAEAARGTIADGSDHGDLVVSAPVFDEEEVVAVVRAAQPTGAADHDAVRARLLMAGLAAAVVTGAGLIGLLVSRRLARPVETLTAAATRLGDGDFATRAPRSGVREIDAAAAALDRTAGRLGDALERERRFSADASHQLRTPLTRLRLALESIGVDDSAASDELIAEALGHADRLEATIDELLALARDVHADRAGTDLGAALDELEAQWHQRFAALGRRFDVRVEPGAGPVALSPVALRHTLDVLVTNALDHGAGRVTVSAAPAAGGGVTIDVGDEGPGFADPDAAFARRGPDATGHGIGLALARSLVEAEGGRLVVSRAAPAPVVKIVVPARDG